MAMPPTWCALSGVAFCAVVVVSGVGVVSMNDAADRAAELELLSTLTRVTAPTA